MPIASTQGPREDRPSRPRGASNVGVRRGAPCAHQVAPAPATAARPSPSSVGDKPLVDPPEFADRIRDTDREPFWIPGTFPTIFQNKTGAPHKYVHEEPDLTTWGPDIMRSRGWAAQAHMTCIYWRLNMVQRIEVLFAKKWFVSDNPHFTGYTIGDLSNMSVPFLAPAYPWYDGQQVSAPEVGALDGPPDRNKDEALGHGRGFIGRCTVFVWHDNFAAISLGGCAYYHRSR